MKQRLEISLYCALCAKTLIMNQNMYCSEDCCETIMAFAKRRNFTPEERMNYVFDNSSIDAYKEAIKLNIFKK